MKSILRLIALIASLACVSALHAYTNNLISSFGVSGSWITVSIETAPEIDTTFEVVDNSTGQVVARITAMTSGGYPYYSSYLQYFSEDYAYGFSGSYYYPGYYGNFSWDITGLAPGDYSLRLSYPDGFDSGYGFYYGTWSAYIQAWVNPH